MLPYPLALFLLFTLSVAARAEDIIAFAGMVTDQGKPVAGATVWLLEGSPESPGMESAKPILFQTTTDHQGQFRLPYCKDKSLAGILVRAVDGRMSEIKNFAVTDDPLHLKCELPPGKEYRGRLVDQTGKPWAGAVIHTERVLGGERKRTDLGQTYFPSHDQHVEVPRLLQQQFQVITGPDGSFVLPGIPHPGLLHLKLTLRPGYEVTVRFDVEREKELVIAQPGKLVLKITGVDDSQALRDSVWGVMSSTDDAAREFGLSCYQLLTNPGSLEMSFEGLHPGYAWSQIEYRSNCPFIYPSDHPTQFTIRSGETTRVSMPLERAINVKGRVIDQTTKAGIGGIGVKVSSAGKSSAALIVPLPTFTKADGTFSRYVRPGLIRCYAIYNTLQAGYLGQSSLLKDHPREVEVTDGQTVWPDIELRRSVSLRGQVLDELGKPVAGAWIHTTQNYYHSRANTPMTDHEGRFQLNNLRPEVLEVYVRSSQGVSPELVKVNLEKPVNEVTLKVDSKAGVYFEGQLIDTLGRPLPHLSLELHVPLRDVPESSASRGLRFWLQPTDAQGRFRVGPFWPGQRYQLTSWVVEQQADFKSTVLVRKPGETLNFGKMVFVGKSK